MLNRIVAFLGLSVGSKVDGRINDPLYSLSMTAVCSIFLEKIIRGYITAHDIISLVMRPAPSLLTVIVLMSAVCCSGDKREQNKIDALAEIDSADLVKGTFYEGSVTYDVFDQSGDQREILEFTFNRNYTLHRRKSQAQILYRSTLEQIFINYYINEIQFYRVPSPVAEVPLTASGEFKVIQGYLCEKYYAGINQDKGHMWLSDQFKPGSYQVQNGQLNLESFSRPLAAKKTMEPISISHEPVRDSVILQYALADSLFLTVPESAFTTRLLDEPYDFFRQHDSLMYPYYGEGRDATTRFLTEKLGAIIKSDSEVYLYVTFIIDKDGSTRPFYEERYNSRADYKDRIAQFITSMKKWTPAKINGVPIRSKVVLFVNNWH